MDLESKYEITNTARFIQEKKFRRVALQLPDELLKDADEVVNALLGKLQPHERDGEDGNKGSGRVLLFVMSYTTYGSCCVDEVGASHVNADCIVHYGRTCTSMPSKLPAFFVFGKSPLDAVNCAEKIHGYSLHIKKPILILFGLEYGHAIKDVREALIIRSSTSFAPSRTPEFHFAEVICSYMNPKEDHDTWGGRSQRDMFTEKDACDATNAMATRYKIGGLAWNLPTGQRMEDYLLIWIGPEDEAFSNILLTFNSCQIVRYDAVENGLVTDFSQHMRILKRRYYLVEKAKDANIIGILVGTLSVAGYLGTIQQMKELITRAGKKAYTLVMRRPNPAKLANFPECDVFVYVSCPQTALLDSKEYLAPVITPFEALLAFDRGRQWTGVYMTDFHNLPPPCSGPQHEARYSFFQGGYVEDLPSHDNNGVDGEEATRALVHSTEKALTKPARSGAEFFAARTYHGLEMEKISPPGPFLLGRSGKASGYDQENVR